MNRFVEQFLDAPLLIERLETAWRNASRRNRLATEMYGMSDRELSDLRMSRADIPYALDQDDQKAA